jgi:hypothetical protein
MAVWENGNTAPLFLTSELGGGDRSASRSDGFTLGKVAAGTHWIEGWVILREGLDDVEKTISRFPANYPSTRYEYNFKKRNPAFFLINSRVETTNFMELSPS